MLVVGTLGYVVVEGATLLDALYMTVISVTTVGFTEVFQLDPAGQVLTMAVIFAGVGTATFATVSAIEFLVEGHLHAIVGRQRMERQLAALDGHAIVCGFGRVGRQVADQLVMEHRRVAVIDPDPERLQMAASRGLPWVEGDASHEEVLRRAGVERANGLVACTADDAENILIALTVKGLQPALFVVVRIKDEQNEPKARRAGADRVIAPAAIGGRRIAALITRPDVVDFIDVVTHASELDLVLEEIVVSDGSALAGASLRAQQVRERYGATVVAVRQQRDRVLNTHPDPDDVLCPGDVLVVIGSRDDLRRLQAVNAR